jgi:general L-amino acid transport system substrate-binding protein
MRTLTRIAILGSALYIAAGATAGPVTERIAQRHLVRCAAVERPGLFTRSAVGPHGLYVDLCRAVAAAVLGDPDRIEFHLYESARDFDAIRSKNDDLFFLSGSEIHQNHLEDVILAGPAVYIESESVLVPATSAARDLPQLAGEDICFLIGSAAERGLEAYFAEHKVSFIRHAYSEDGEMNDAYQVQQCHALAGERTTLASSAAARAQLSSRILPSALIEFPIIAATSTEDGPWAAIVHWTILTLLAADRPGTAWSAGGKNALPIQAAELGLAGDWQKRVLEATGSYSSIYERNLGAGSPLKLDAGPNANRIESGILIAPFIE